MSDANFYQILGVGRSASADEIRSAYRELVKKHHPDLFSAPREKTQATETLREINEAYAVLGNVERRRRYDERFVQKPQARPRARTAPSRPRPARPRGADRENRRAKPGKISLSRNGKLLLGKAANILKERFYVSRKRAAYALSALLALLVTLYANRSEPRLITAWTLLEKIELSVSKDDTPVPGDRQDWVPVGQFASVSECVGLIKDKIRKDEQEGSRAVFVEPNGTMAIAVLVDKEAVQPSDQTNEPSPRAGITRRVRNLECRATQRVTMESRFAKTLRQLGLSR